MIKVLVVLLVLFGSSIGYGQVTNWEDSSQNWRNSKQNWENSSRNWENSPGNWQNNPRNIGSERIIRDNDGRAVGYGVEKGEGGKNYYDLEGNRVGYGR